MPAHPNVPGIEAFIFVDGQPCEEYNERTPVAPNHVERYIVAESGAAFQVLLRFKSPFPTDLPVSVMVSIDGKDMDEMLIRQDELYEEEGHVSMGPISNTEGEWRKQRYRFATLDTSENVPEEKVEVQKQKLLNTGTISLHVYGIKIMQRNTGYQSIEKTVEDYGVVHEKALKGDPVSHSVSLDRAESTEEVEYFKAEYANEGEPFAVFHFYYRSLKSLKELHIIRRSPSPSPISLNEITDDVIMTSSPEQFSKMVAYWKRQAAQTPNNKRERSDSVTIVGDDESAADDERTDDVTYLGCTDVRAQRLKRRKPSYMDEVIVLD